MYAANPGVVAHGECAEALSHPVSRAAGRMPPLTWHADLGPGSLHVAVRGRPDDRSVRALGARLGELSDRAPHELTVDLSAVTPADRPVIIGGAIPARHITFVSGDAMLLRDAGRHSPVPLGSAGGCLGPRLSRSLVRVDEALMRGPLTTPFVVEQLLPLPGAARHGRTVVRDACRAWNLDEVADDAALAASELVTHTIWRASTIMTLAVMRRGRHLFVWARGGGGAPWSSRSLEPQLELLVVHTIADCWGFYPSDNDDDVVTWAALPSARRPCVSSNHR